MMLLAQEDNPSTNNEPAPEDAITQSAGKAVNDVKTAANDALEGDLSGLWGLLEGYAVPAISALLLLIIGYFAAKLFSRMASMPIRQRVDETLGRFVGKVIFYSIMLFTLLGVLGMFGVSVTSFAAVIGAAGFAVGLAFQGSLSNFAAGVLLLVFRPFKAGDVISAAGVTAKVIEIDLFVTLFNTPDNRRFIVPNSKIMGDTIENISFHDERRVDVSVGVDYTAKLDDTRAALSRAAERQNELMLQGEDRGYQIVLGELGDSAVVWTVRFWARSEDFWGVKEQLTADVKSELDAVGIGIPYPQMDVHVKQSA